MFYTYNTIPKLLPLLQRIVLDIRRTFADQDHEKVREYVKELSHLCIFAWNIPENIVAIPGEYKGNVIFYLLNPLQETKPHFFIESVSTGKPTLHKILENS